MCLKLMPFGLAVNSEKTLKKKRKKEKALIVISTFAYILGQTDVEPFAGSTSPPPLYLKLRKTVERKNILIYFDTRKFFWLLRGWK